MYKKYSKKDLTDLTEGDLKAYHKDISEDLEIIRIVMDSALKGYDETTGAYRTVSVATRKKSVESFLAKFNSIKNKKEKLDRLTSHVRDNNDKFYIFNLFHDFVGSRIITYFSDQLRHPLRYIISWPLFKVNKIIVYQSNGRPWVTESLQKMLDGINKSKDLVSYPEPQNSSSYESIHIHLTLNDFFSDEIKERLISHSDNYNKDVDLTNISNYTIELQIRTLMQHAWAQSEHYLNYSSSKKGSIEGGSLNKNYLISMQDDFEQLKVSLHAAECMQNLIWKRHIANNLTLHVKEESVGFDGRLHPFDGDSLKNLSAIHDSTVSEVNSPEKLEVNLNSLMNFAYGLDKKLYSSEKSDSTAGWAKQRTFLLLLAYLAFIVRDDESIDILIEHINKHFKEMKSNNILLTSERIYTTVRLWDDNFLHEHNDNGLDCSAQDKDIIFQFIDPLIPYRRAYIHYKDSNPSFALKQIETAINDRQKLLDFNCSIKDKKLTLKHLNRRKAQCHWAIYLMFADGTDYHLRLSLETLRYALDEADKEDRFFDKEKNKIENAKIASMLIIILYCRFVYKNKWGQFKPAKFKDSVIKLMTKSIEDDMNFSIESEMDKRGVISLAYALFLSINNEMESANAIITSQNFIANLSPELEDEWDIYSSIRSTILSNDI